MTTKPAFLVLLTVALLSAPTLEGRTLAERFTDLSMTDRRQVGPLFWLHGTETPEKLAEMVDVVQASGQGMLTVESRNHCDWMGPIWWRDLDIVLARARKCDLKVIIFDDPWWPSQGMQGRVPDAYGCHVVVPRVCRAGEAVPAAASNEICRVACREMAKEVFEPASDGDVTVVFLDERRDVKVNEGGKLLRTVNGLDPASVAWFIDAVYAEHYRRYESYFRDGTIIGYFFDEPETHGSWGPALRDLLQKDGEDLAKLLLAYTFRLSDPEESANLRHRFLRARAEAWGRTMYGAISAWCREHGVFSSGHFMEHEHEFYSQKLCAGDVMAMEKYVDVPGIDLVCEQYYPSDQQPGNRERLHRVGDLPLLTRRVAMGQMPLISSSVAHVRKAHGGLNWCEIFGGYHQHLTYTDMKWLADWHHVRGCHMLIPHSFNPKAPNDTDYPPYFYNGGTEPRFPLFRVWADYTSRIALLMSGLGHRCPVAQVLPGQSHNTGRTIRPEMFAFALQDAQLDCDWFSIDDLVEAEITRDAVSGLPAIRSAKGEERYPVLVLPATDRLEFPALEKALAFARAGGRVIGYAIRPAATPTRGRTAAEVKKLTDELFALESAVFLPSEPTASEVLSAMPAPVVAGARRFQAEGVPVGNLHVRQIVRDDAEIWFVANQSTTECRTVKPWNGFEVWDPMQGAITRAAGPITLEPAQALFLVKPSVPTPEVVSARNADACPLAVQRTKNGASFTIDALSPATRIVVRCADIVGEPAARVTVNGSYAGGFIGAPLELDITRFVKTGANVVKLEPFVVGKLEIVLR